MQLHCRRLCVSQALTPFRVMLPAWLSCPERKPTHMTLQVAQRRLPPSLSSRPPPRRPQRQQPSQQPSLSSRRSRVEARSGTCSNCPGRLRRMLHPQRQPPSRQSRARLLLHRAPNQLR